MAPSGSSKLTRVPDTLGLAWVIVAGFAAFVPALAHGAYLGPVDLLSRFGLTAQRGVTVHNAGLSDQITIFIPWAEQVWTQVHQGHLPLWNPDSGLGMPLAFNWESAPFGLPAIVGYLFPMRFVYTVAILVTVAVGGSGAYVFARVIRLGVIASALVGTVFVLSGPVAALLGWSAASVDSWTGWLFAASLLVINGNRRVAAIAGFAVVLALSIYAGHPESSALLVLALGLFLAIVLIRRLPAFGSPGPILKPVVDLALATVAGLALAAPLLLPGLQLANASTRTSGGGFQITGSENIQHLLTQGFDGLGTAGSPWFGPLGYQVSAAYVGAIVLVLGVVAIFSRWRRPEVLGLTAVTILMGAFAFSPAVVAGMKHVPVLSSVFLVRALVPMVFGLACLGGVGLDAVVKDFPSLRTRRLVLGGFVSAAGVLAVLWIFGRGHLSPIHARVRAESFIWPAIAIGVGLGVSVYLIVRRNTDASSRRSVGICAAVLLVTETVFLVASGAPLWTSSAHPLAPSPAVVKLHRVVGSSLVGLGKATCVSSIAYGTSALGIIPETNVAFGVHELALYDPVAPENYYSAWQADTGQPGGVPFFALFCPAITSTVTARLFGVEYVLEPQAVRGPAGSVRSTSVGNEVLYRVPGAAQATLVPAPTNRPLPPITSAGSPVHVVQPNPSTWKIATDLPTPQVLRLRIANVPGWHASVDGRPAKLSMFAGLMLQTRVPAGRHTVVVTYWPISFTIGLVLAALSGMALFTAGILSLVTGRRTLSGKRETT